MRAGDDQKIAIRLEPGRNRPFDLAWLVDIHVHVDHDHLLDVVVARERAHDDVLRLALARLIDLDRQMIAAGSAARQADVADRGEAALEMFEQRRFAGNSAEQQMLHAAADDGVEDRAIAVRDGVDLITSRSARGP